MATGRYGVKKDRLTPVGVSSAAPGAGRRMARRSQ
jgi:hypothetical protein